MLEMLRERKAALEAQGKKGFTLMEMLIVIAIIAILIAIAIPVMTDQLERANETADVANIRSAYAQGMAAAATNQTDSSTLPSGVKYVSGTGWQVTTQNMKSTGEIEKIGDLPSYIAGLDTIKITPGSPVTITVTADGSASVA